MFELDVKVQVLRRGTMFGVRGLKLYELYRTYDSLASHPRPRARRVGAQHPACERGGDLGRDASASGTVAIPRNWNARRADSKHRMALLFRWYLGRSSRLGHRRRHRAQGRLPALVRAGSGRLQPLGGGRIPRRVPRARRSYRSPSICWRARPPCSPGPTSCAAWDCPCLTAPSPSFPGHLPELIQASGLRFVPVRFPPARLPSCPVLVRCPAPGRRRRRAVRPALRGHTAQRLLAQRGHRP